MRQVQSEQFEWGHMINLILSFGIHNWYQMSVMGKYLTDLKIKAKRNKLSKSYVISVLFQLFALFTTQSLKAYSPVHYEKVTLILPSHLSPCTSTACCSMSGRNILLGSAGFYLAFKLLIKTGILLPLLIMSLLKPMHSCPVSFKCLHLSHLLQQHSGRVWLYQLLERSKGSNDLHS